MSSVVESMTMCSAAITATTALVQLMFVLQNVQDVISVHQPQRSANCKAKERDFFTSFSCLHAAFSQHTSTSSNSSSRLRRVVRSANTDTAEKPIRNSDFESNRQQSSYNSQDRNAFTRIPSHLGDESESHGARENENDDNEETFSSSRHDYYDRELEFIDDKQWMKRNSLPKSNEAVFSPVADMRRMRHSLLNLFALPRNEYTNFTIKNIVRQAIIDEFLENDLQTYTHKFSAIEMTYLVSMRA